MSVQKENHLTLLLGAEKNAILFRKAVHSLSHLWVDGHNSGASRIISVL